VNASYGAPGEDRQTVSVRGIRAGLPVAMYRVVLKILVLTLGAAAAATVVVCELPERQADAEPHTSRPLEVQSVALEGRDLPIAALRSVLVSHSGDTVDTVKLTEDRAALRGALVSSGYLDAKVQAAQVVFDASGGAYLTFAVTPGPLFHVGKVTVTGAQTSDSGILTVGRGDVVRTDRLEQARDALTTRLASRGRPEHVTVRVVPDPRTSTADVVLAAN
jgi:hemolysin activation/secretion protein